MNKNVEAQNMQIYAIIAQMEEAVDGSPKPKLSSGNKRVIDFDEIMDLIGDLKVTIPEDIRRANKVMLDSENMINSADEHARDVVSEAQIQAEQTVNNANAQAEHIMEQAKAEYERLISEDEIYQEAQNRAKLLAMKAEANANMVYENAKVYADQVLQSLENLLVEYRQLVVVNRRDLDIKADKVNPVIDTNKVDVQENTVPVANAPVNPAPQNVRSPKKQRADVVPIAKKPEATVDEEYEDDFVDDFSEENNKGGLFGWLKRGKKNDENINFDDDEKE